MSYTLEIAGEAEPVSEAEVSRAEGRVAVAQAGLRRARSGAAWETAQRALRASVLELYRIRPHIFALTGGAMALAQNVMKVYGMLDPVVRQPPFPTLAEYGVTDQMIQDAAREDDAERRELAHYRAAYDAALERQPAENPGGIPLYKLVSPDGWLVTPDEISAALGAYRSGLDEVPDTGLWWWPAWIEFLERAEKNRGFRVR